MTYIPKTGHFNPKIHINPRHYYFARKDQFIYSGSGVGDDGDVVNEWIDSGRVGGKNFRSGSVYSGEGSFESQHVSNSQAFLKISDEEFQTPATTDLNFIHNGTGATVGIILTGHLNVTGGILNIFKNGGGSAGEVGMTLRYRSSSQLEHPRLHIANGATLLTQHRLVRAPSPDIMTVCFIYRLKARTNTETNDSDPDQHEIELRMAGEKMLGHILTFDPSNDISGIDPAFGSNAGRIDYFEFFVEDSWLGDEMVKKYEDYAVKKYGAVKGLKFKRA